MLPKHEAAINTDLEKWLARNGVKNAYEKWHDAPASSRPFLAFVAIAADQELLLRTSGSDAKYLVNDARIALGNYLLNEESNSPAKSVTDLVQQRIELWQRRSLLQDDQAQRRAILPQAPKDAGTALALMVDAFPQIRPECARFAMETTLKIGAEGLANMDTKAASALALNAARVAVRCAEGRMHSVRVPRSDSFNVLRIVQNWSLAAEHLPFNVEEYPEQIDLAKCLAGLAFDAHACANMAAQLPGGCGDPGYILWEEAAETFGYALLRVRHFLFETFERRVAMSIASAGGRLASRAINDPSTRLPILPDQPGQLLPDDPHVVVLRAHELVGGSFSRRRSEIQRMAAQI